MNVIANKSSYFLLNASKIPQIANSLTVQNENSFTPKSQTQYELLTFQLRMKKRKPFRWRCAMQQADLHVFHVYHEPSGQLSTRENHKERKFSTTK
jgi:hypothetical protein